MALAAEASPGRPGGRGRRLRRRLFLGPSRRGASQAAAQAGLPVLVAAVQAGGDLGEASRAAVAAARQAIADLQGPGGDTRRPRSCPPWRAAAGDLVLARRQPRLLAGASHADEIPAASRRDDSRGRWHDRGSTWVDEAAAMASPHAHVLTRWLGGEAADLADDPERAPHVERFTPPGAGSLLICSDGLWNYLAEGAALARLALPKALTDPLWCRRRHGEVRGRRWRRRQHHSGPDPVPRPRDPLTGPRSGRNAMKPGSSAPGLNGSLQQCR